MALRLADAYTLGIGHGNLFVGGSIDRRGVRAKASVSTRLTENLFAVAFGEYRSRLDWFAAAGLGFRW